MTQYVVYYRGLRFVVEAEGLRHARQIALAELTEDIASNMVVDELETD